MNEEQVLALFAQYAAEQKENEAPFWVNVRRLSIALTKLCEEKLGERNLGGTGVIEVTITCPRCKKPLTVRKPASSIAPPTGRCVCGFTM